MDVGLLYSGGKDSTLAALLLDPVADVTLVTGRFGITDDWKNARATAAATGFDFVSVDLDPSIATRAVNRMVDDGYPRNGIQMVHVHALETLAESDGFDAVADGTRRDDRVPQLSNDRVQSLEDRNGVEYIRPLQGFGRGAVDDVVERTLQFEAGPSEEIPRADYEAELRTLLANEYGPDAVGEIFPEHEQTYVTGHR